MKDKIKIEYRGFTINYQDGLEDAYTLAGDDHDRKSYPTLDKITDAIDRMLKNKFDPVAILMFGHDGVKEGTATSKTDDGGVWVSYEKKKDSWGSNRGKHTSGIYYDTPENREIAKQIIELNKKFEDFRNETNKEHKNLINKMSAVCEKENEAKAK